MSDSHEFKLKLKDALSKAVEYFQESGDPDSACIKAANDFDFNKDQADRLVEAFNTARVICHYKVSDDKSSSCSLANKDTVRGGITMTDTVEKQSEYNTLDYGSYNEPEVDWVVREVKVAKTKLVEEPISKEASDWLACREAQVIKDLLKTAAEESRAANAMADELAEKVAMAMSRNVSIDAVHDKVARLVVAFADDERYAPGVEKVASFLPEASDPPLSVLNKYASRHVVDVDDLNDILPTIKEAADFVAAASALDAYRIESTKSAELPVLGDYIDELRVSLSDGAVSKQQKRVEKATDSVNNLRRQLILQDLLLTDKILSKESPGAVIEAFRSMNQISPDSTLNKEITRSVLRNAVQSVAISPYDAKSLVDVDKVRRQAYTKE